MTTTASEEFFCNFFSCVFDKSEEFGQDWSLVFNISICTEKCQSAQNNCTSFLRMEGVGVGSSTYKLGACFLMPLTLSIPI